MHRRATERNLARLLEDGHHFCTLLLCVRHYALYALIHVNMNRALSVVCSEEDIVFYHMYATPSIYYAISADGSGRPIDGSITRSATILPSTALYPLTFFIQFDKE